MVCVLDVSVFVNFAGFGGLLIELTNAEALPKPGRGFKVGVALALCPVPRSLSPPTANDDLVVNG